MLAVVLSFTYGILEYYIVDLSTSTIIAKNPDFCPYLDEDNHVIGIFNKYIWKDYSANGISTVLITGENYSLQREEKYIKAVEDYMNKLNIFNVRYLDTNIRPLTNSLLKLKNSGVKCVVGNQVLMVYSVGEKDTLVAQNVTKFIKHEEGWRYIKLKPNKDFCTNGDDGVSIQDCVLACGVELEKIDYIVVNALPAKSKEQPIHAYKKLYDFHDPSKIFVIDDFGSKLDAVVYLSKLYAGCSSDFCSYIPKSNNLMLRYTVGKVKSQFDFDFTDILPSIKTVEFHSEENDIDLGLLLIAFDNGKTDTLNNLKIPGVRGKTIKLVAVINENSRVGLDARVLENNRWEPRASLNLDVVQAYYPRITMKKKKIRTKFWNNGLLTDLMDTNGLLAIPSRISFMSAIPIIGSAVTDEMKPMPYDISRLFDREYVSQRIHEGFTDLVIDGDGIVVIVETKAGLQKVTPISILAIFITCIVKLLKLESGQPVEGIKLEFDSNLSAVDVNRKKLSELVKVQIV